MMETDDGREAGSVRHLPLALESDLFLRTLLRHLAGTLEEVIGIQEASGFISVVGQRMGDEMNAGYTEALGVPRLTRSQVSAVLVDLKRRIRGDFFVIEQDDDKIILGNRACPFGEKVAGRPSLCMMTSNVFGAIAAQNLGYARVVVEEAIALGHPGCRVVLYLRPSTGTDQLEGREYFEGS